MTHLASAVDSDEPFQIGNSVIAGRDTMNTFWDSLLGYTSGPNLEDFISDFEKAEYMQLILTNHAICLASRKCMVRRPKCA